MVLEIKVANRPYHLSIIRSVRVLDADVAYKCACESVECRMAILRRCVRADDSSQLHCTFSPAGYLPLSAARERCSFVRFGLQHWTYSSRTASLWIPFMVFKCEVSWIYAECRKWHYSVNTALILWVCRVYHSSSVFISIFLSVILLYSFGCFCRPVSFLFSFFFSYNVALFFILFSSYFLISLIFLVSFFSV